MLCFLCSLGICLFLCLSVYDSLLFSVVGLLIECLGEVCCLGNFGHCECGSKDCSLLCSLCLVLISLDLGSVLLVGRKHLCLLLSLLYLLIGCILIGVRSLVVALLDLGVVLCFLCSLCICLFLCLGIKNCLLLCIVCFLVEALGEVCSLGNYGHCERSGKNCSLLCSLGISLFRFFLGDFFLICKKERILLVIRSQRVTFVSVVLLVIISVAVSNGSRLSLLSIESLSFLCHSLFLSGSRLSVCLPVGIVSLSVIAVCIHGYSLGCRRGLSFLNLLNSLVTAVKCNESRCGSSLILLSRSLIIVNLGTALVTSRFLSRFSFSLGVINCGCGLLGCEIRLGVAVNHRYCGCCFFISVLSHLSSNLIVLSLLLFSSCYCKECRLFSLSFCLFSLFLRLLCRSGFVSNGRNFLFSLGSICNNGNYLSGCIIGLEVIVYGHLGCRSLGILYLFALVICRKSSHSRLVSLLICRLLGISVVYGVRNYNGYDSGCGLLARLNGNGVSLCVRIYRFAHRLLCGLKNLIRSVNHGSRGKLGASLGVLIIFIISCGRNGYYDRSVKFIIFNHNRVGKNYGCGRCSYGSSLDHDCGSVCIVTLCLLKCLDTLLFCLPILEKSLCFLTAGIAALVELGCRHVRACHLGYAICELGHIGRGILAAVCRLGYVSGELCEVKRIFSRYSSAGSAAALDLRSGGIGNVDIGVSSYRSLCRLVPFSAFSSLGSRLFSRVEVKHILSLCDTGINSLTYLDSGCFRLGISNRGIIIHGCCNGGSGYCNCGSGCCCLSLFSCLSCSLGALLACICLKQIRCLGSTCVKGCGCRSSGIVCDRRLARNDGRSHRSGNSRRFNLSRYALALILFVSLFLLLLAVVIADIGCVNRNRRANGHRHSKTVIVRIDILGVIVLERIYLSGEYGELHLLAA